MQKKKGGQKFRLSILWGELRSICIKNATLDVPSTGQLGFLLSRSQIFQVKKPDDCLDPDNQAGRSLRTGQDLKTGNNDAATLSVLRPAFCQRKAAQDNRNSLLFIHLAICANAHRLPAVSQGKRTLPHLTQSEITKFKV